MVLEIHFNTRTIVDDMQRLLDGDSGRDKVKCKLQYLTVGNLPLEVFREDIGTIEMGFTYIFPHLEDFLPDHWQIWEKVAAEPRD